MKKKITKIFQKIGIYKPLRYLYNKIARYNKQTNIKFEGQIFNFWTPTFYLNDYVNNFAGEKELLKEIIQHLNKNEVLWDIGANVGFHSILIEKLLNEKNCSVIAFEPEADTFKLLQKNILLNRSKNLTAYNFAIGEKNYQRNIYSSDTPNFGAHSFVHRSDYKVKNRGKSVKVFSVDSLIKEKRLTHPTTIKIDVEGAEILVLKGMADTLKNSKLKTIFLEGHINLLHSFNSSIKEVLDLIRASGFQLEQKFNRENQEQFIFTR